GELSCGHPRRQASPARWLGSGLRVSDGHRGHRLANRRVLDGPNGRHRRVQRESAAGLAELTGGMPAGHAPWVSVRGLSSPALRRRWATAHRHKRSAKVSALVDALAGDAREQRADLALAVAAVAAKGAN